jgi:hypothetical protein
MEEPRSWGGGARRGVLRFGAHDHDNYNCE